MLDAFLEVAYAQQTRHDDNVKLAHVLKELPLEDLHKLVTGEAKLAFGDCSPDWIEKYKGTPLFEQALALEKADLEAEVARTQAQAAAPPWDELNRTSDGIRVQKKMLDLELLKQSAGASGGTGSGQDKSKDQPMSVIPNGEQQGAGAMGDPGPDVEPQKLSSADPVKALGEKLAMAKKALDMKALGGMASKAVDFAKKNPKAVGTALGAAGGALTSGPDHRLSGAVGGAMLGHSAGGIGSHMMQGKNLGAAVQAHGADLGTMGNAIKGKLQNAVKNMGQTPAVPPTV